MSLSVPIESRPRRLKAFLQEHGFIEADSDLFVKDSLSVKIKAGWDGIEIHDIFLPEAERGKGFASKFMADLIEAAHQFMLPILVVDRNLDWKARAFFEKHGFSNLPHGLWAFEKKPAARVIKEAEARPEKKSRIVAKFVFGALSLTMFFTMLLGQ